MSEIKSPSFFKNVLKQVGIPGIFKSKFISMSKTIQVNPRLESFDYSEGTWKYQDIQECTT